jgi:hypothetical protein
MKAEDLLHNLKKLQGVKIRWGVHGERLSKIAFWNEFGATVKNGFGKGIKIVIPERAAHRGCFRSKETQSALSKAAAVAIDKVMDGGDVAAAANVIGEIGLGKLRQSYASNIPPANAPSTIAKKGAGKNTLYDTGDLQSNLAYEVVGA